MNNSASDPLPAPERHGLPDAVRVQILATEHWGLLATRNILWNECLARASMFLTVLSAAMVALALVADATDFGRSFRMVAFLVLPVVLFLGWATFARISASSAEDIYAVVGMNRLRHAYLDLAPDLEPYFVTSQFDDPSGVMQSLSLQPAVGRGGGISAVLASTPLLVAIISAVVAGAFAGLVADTLGAGTTGYVTAGALVGMVYAATLFTVHVRAGLRIAQDGKPRFPRTIPPRAPDHAVPPAEVDITDAMAQGTVDRAAKSDGELQ